MIARFLRIACLGAALVGICSAVFADETPPLPPPVSGLVPGSPAAAATAPPDSGWAPAPGTAAYVPPPPSAQPTPASPKDSKGALDKIKREMTPGQRAYELTRDASYLEPTSWNVTAWKSRHVMIVYYKGRLYKTYRAVFGRNHEPGTKQYEGDRKTPEGVYAIIEKHWSRRWRWFLGLNYPNNIDRYRYGQMLDADEVPTEDHGREAGTGGHIGIHGTDLPILNSGDIDWTTGCISVDNRDIDELNRILPVGTVVIINP
jgi:lipoprotein-anchoring transpeptidase ErfK/SrfK